MSVRLCLARFLLGSVSVFGAPAGPGTDPGGALEEAVSAAEERLHAGDPAAAEAHYREALFQGWLLRATLERLEGRSTQAREAVRSAAPYVGDRPGDLRSLAAAYVQTGENDAAVDILSGLVVTDDPEMTFMVATDFLWLKRIESAERLFAQLLGQRPTAQTRVLVGHAYRDAGEYGRARAELRAALEQDPRVRRAHYYLGTVILADPGTGPDRAELALGEFQQEVEVAPDDALAWDQLGTALLELGRHTEGLQAIEKAVRLEARASYVYHLGRPQLALDRPADAVASSRRALELAQEQGATPSELERIHYQLGLALRKVGATQDAAVHLTEAKRIAARWTAVPTGEKAEASALSKLTPSERLNLSRRVTSALAQTYLNLGVMQAQGERLAQAIELFERAAELDPDFPQVQYSLGIARFNARQFDKATDPLARALAANPGDVRLKRMLAMACLDTQAYAKAAELLQDDPERATGPSLQFAYGLALAHNGREAEAEAIFTKLLQEQGQSAELNEALRQVRARR